MTALTRTGGHRVSTGIQSPSLKAIVSRKLKGKKRGDKTNPGFIQQNPFTTVHTFVLYASIVLSLDY